MQLFLVFNIFFIFLCTQQRKLLFCLEHLKSLKIVQASTLCISFSMKEQEQLSEQQQSVHTWEQSSYHLMKSEPCMATYHHLAPASQISTPAGLSTEQCLELPGKEVVKKPRMITNEKFLTQEKIVSWKHQPGEPSLTKVACNHYLHHTLIHRLEHCLKMIVNKESCLQTM